MTQRFDHITYSDAEPPVATVTISTGGKENWLTAKTFSEIQMAIREAESSSPKIRFLVFQSRVEGVFSYGCDVTTKDDTVQAEPLIREMVKVAQMLLERKVISIAKVDGICVGGGWELVMLCTLSYASERSLFRLPEILVECQPPIATAIFPALVGRAKALDYLLSARVVGGRQASDEGIVSQAFPNETFEQEFTKTIRRLSDLSSQRSFEAIQMVADGDQSVATEFYDELERRRNEPSADVAAFLLTQLVRQREASRGFPRALWKSLKKYKELVETGAIQAGIQKYWSTRREGKRHIRDTPQGFSLDGLKPD